MQETANICQVRVTGVTYDQGAIVCTAKTNANGWDNVYQCTNSRGCKQVPGVNSEWVITRRRGTITEVVEVVAAYDYEWDTPYALNDHVVYLDQLYKCVSARGFCTYFPPDVIDSWVSDYQMEEFAFDETFEEFSFGPAPY